MSAKKGGVDLTMGKPTRLRDAGNLESDVAGKSIAGASGPSCVSTLPLLAELDMTKWCAALLAYSRGQEVECNLTRGHVGAHQHVTISDAGVEQE